MHEALIKDMETRMQAAVWLGPSTSYRSGSCSSHAA